MNQDDFQDGYLDGYLDGIYQAGYEAALQDAGIPAEQIRRQNRDGSQGGNPAGNQRQNSRPFWKTKYKFLLMPPPDLNRGWKRFVKVVKYCNQAALAASNGFEAKTDQYFENQLKWAGEI
jgi:hypothetical protein